MRNAFLFLLTACAAWSQTPSPRLEFEVASVKPAPPPEGNRIRISMAGGPGTPDPGRINYEFVNLRMVLTEAYDVKSYQINGSGLLDTERFNITATVPAGSTKAQVRVMLQNLLADRFKVTLHREQKDLQAYSLVAGKGGPRMKPSAPEDPNAPTPEMEAPPPGRMPMGRDGFPQAPAGAGRGMRMMMMPGRMKLSANAMPVSELAQTLERQLDRAVVDNTELKGKYDFELTFEPEQNKMMAGLVMGRGGPPPGAEGGPPTHSPDAEAPPNIFTAVQEQLGLKLEPKKIPVEVLVIDHVEKTPIEN